MKLKASRARIPVHVVTGAAGSGKSALIARLVRARADWLGLSNAQPAPPATNLRLLSGGCPCCTGRVALQVALVRGLRDTRSSRAFVELPDPRHAAIFTKLLGELPLSLSVARARTIVLPQDASFTAGDLETAA